MSDAPVTFRLSIEGDERRIYQALRAVDGPQPKGTHVGPIEREFLESRAEREDPEDDVCGVVTLPDADTLARLIPAVMDAKPTYWYVELEIETLDGVRVYATLPSSRCTTHRATANVRVDRAAMLGAVVGHVKEARAALDRALAGEAKP